MLSYISDLWIWSCHRFPLLYWILYSVWQQYVFSSRSYRRLNSWCAGLWKTVQRNWKTRRISTFWKNVSWTILHLQSDSAIVPWAVWRRSFVRMLTVQWIFLTNISRINLTRYREKRTWLINMRAVLVTIWWSWQSMRWTAPRQSRLPFIFIPSMTLRESVTMHPTLPICPVKCMIITPISHRKPGMSWM